VARLERDVAAAEVGGTPSPRDDLRVRQRFLQTLEVCKAYGRMCPPRLDEPAWQYDIESDADPTLDAPLRFDVESWRKVADELHGRACACRSLACVDSMEVALARLETRPMPDVRQDDVASLSVTSARDCLNRLRGGRAVPHP
jgi:hypothetical protein